ncbi:DUF4239 domain-containing protein [Variovorax sp. KK3]|uniref:bestrophin-like domain n=1 Tax=Variovorax sp. KK3 TaxID=1855728 RepID=UPI00097C41E1|nr:DUF4239 domain-containing protein [Variovorax sp. KK3]
MRASLISIGVFTLTVAALHLGNRLAARLPSHHLADDARHVAHVGIGMLATLLALVLGLTITSAKHAFDDRGAEVVKVASTAVLLDRALAGYGPAAQPVRAELAQLFAQMRARVDHHAPSGILTAPHAPMANLAALTQLQHAVLQLKPDDESQKWYQARAMQLSTDIALDRVLHAESGDSSIPPAVLAIVIAWVLLIYLGLGVFGADNATVKVTLGVCAFAFACALFMVMELDTPYAGVIGVSTEPLTTAARALGN